MFETQDVHDRVVSRGAEDWGDWEGMLWWFLMHLRCHAIGLLRRDKQRCRSLDGFWFQFCILFKSFQHIKGQDVSSEV